MPLKNSKATPTHGDGSPQPKDGEEVGIPQSVGRDFTEADKGKKFKEGGMATKCFGGKESKLKKLES